MKVRIVQATPTITASSAYSSGNCIGGVMTFAGLADRGYSTLLSLAIADKSGQGAACDLFLFNSAPSAQTNKSAVALTSADLLKCIGVVPVASADFASGGTGSVAGKSKGNLFIGVGESTDNNVYGLLVSRGTPTYVSTSDIVVSIAAEVSI